VWRDGEIGGSMEGERVRIVQHEEINRDVGANAQQALERDILKAKQSFSELLKQVHGSEHVCRRLEALVCNVFDKCKSDREQFRLLACCMKYRDYLKTEHWIKVRSSVLEAYEHACSFCCAGDDLHVHHRTYKRIGNEKWGDVVVLCKECHSVFHANRKADGQFEYGENETKTECDTKDKCKDQKKRKSNDIQTTTRQARNV
jgi:hypothetical protein